MKGTDTNNIDRKQSKIDGSDCFNITENCMLKNYLLYDSEY